MAEPTVAARTMALALKAPIIKGAISFLHRTVTQCVQWDGDRARAVSKVFTSQTLEEQGPELRQ